MARPFVSSTLSSIAGRCASIWLLLVIAGILKTYGHHCGVPKIVVEVGRTATYRITADLSESEPSHYNMSINSDPNISVASPDNFDAFNFGEFTIRGVAPGTNTFVFEWSYEPTQGAGFCVVEVVVVERGSTTTTAADNPQSGHAGDPVNTFTGDFILQELEDLQLMGPMPLYFARYYASGLMKNGEVHGSLGPNWTHNFEFRLRLAGDVAEVITDRGRVVTFQSTGGGWALQGGGEPFQLVKEGDLYLFGDPGSQKVYVFNAEGLLERIEDGKGNSHTLTYTGNALSQVTDGLGRELNFSYVSLQQLREVRSGERKVDFSYGVNLELRTVRNALNLTSTYVYQGGQNGMLLTAKVLPLGKSHWTNIYDASGRIEAQKDAYGNTYYYKHAAGLTTITNPLGGVEVHVHNDLGQLVRVTDEAGKSIELGYDSEGNRSRIEDREGGITLISYNSAGKPASVTNADGTIVRYTYTPRTYRGITFHDLAEVEYPDGTAEMYARDAQGNVLTFTARNGGVWEYTYNNRGQVLTAKNPTGGVKTFTYMPSGMLASVTAGGGTTSFEYDAAGRMVKEQHADGAKRLFERDLLDRVVRTTNELGHVLVNTYDANGNLLARSHSDMPEHKHEFDDMDRLTRFIGPGGVDAELKFDAMGRTSLITFNGTRTNKFIYDMVGNVVAVEDAEGSLWRSEFDAEGVLKQTINPLNKTNIYETDAMGRVVAFTSGEGNKRIMSYDPAGRLKSVTAPDQVTSTLVYENGLLKSLTVGGGLSSSFAYNALGREIEMKDAGGNAWKQEYDANGRRTATIDPLGRRTEYLYDSRGRVQRATFPDNAGHVEIEWDGLNAIRRRLYSDGTALQYNYDIKGHLMSANGVTLERDADGMIVQCNGIAMTRGAAKRVESVTYAPAKSVIYTYNKRGQVETMTDWLGGTYTFTYDAAGRLAAMERPNQSQNQTVSTSDFEYDGENRLAVVAHTNQMIISIVRDTNGRIKQTTRNESQASGSNLVLGNYTYDAAAQPMQGTSDSLGNVTTLGPRTYKWNLAGRLTEYTEGGVVTQNEYDAFGQRISRRRGTETKHYVWNYGMGMPAVFIERNGDGADQWYYLYTPGGLLVAAINAAGERYEYFFDENGNTISLCDATGKIVNRNEYGPYGEVLSAVEGVPNPFTYQGKYGVMHDGGGLYYMRARWYDSATCRFLSRDPLKSKLPKATNPYQYALNNPVKYNDPLGLQAVEGQDGPGAGEVPESGREAARSKGNVSTGEEEDPVATGTPPNSGVVYLTHEEWNTEVRRVKRLLHDRVKKAEYGWLDPQVPATFDSSFLARQRERFYFRGLVMNGGELNYYFQGMYWKELGVPKGTMIAIIYAYKNYKYGRGPSVNDLYAACHGYEDNANFWTEMRDEAKYYSEIIESVPEALGEVILEQGSALVDLVKPWVPSFGE